MFESELTALKEIHKAIKPIAEARNTLALERLITAIETANKLEAASKHKED